MGRAASRHVVKVLGWEFRMLRGNFANREWSRWCNLTERAWAGATALEGKSVASLHDTHTPILAMINCSIHMEVPRYAYGSLLVLPNMTQSAPSSHNEHD
jgi:hypothetical protein